MKKLVIRIIGQILSITIFVTVFFVSLFITYGYRYNFEERQVVQTSVIDICSIPKQADLYLDNEHYSDKACVKIFGINLGYHEITIKKDGYMPWNKTVNLNREQVSFYPKILLLPKPEFYQSNILKKEVDQVWISPNQSRYAIHDSTMNLIKVFSASRATPRILEAPTQIQNLIWITNNRLAVDTSKGRYEVDIDKNNWKLTDKLIFRPHFEKTDLSIEENELWKIKKDEKIFITRYARPIQSAQYFFNQFNLLIATDNEIRICDFEGENCHVISEKDSNTPVAHPARSKKIIFIKNKTLRQITLNGPSETNYLEISL